MGQVHVQVILTNHREAVMAQFGQLDPNRVHRHETEVLIGTGARRSVIPPARAYRLGLYRIRRTEARAGESARRPYTRHADNAPEVKGASERGDGYDPTDT